VLFYVSHNAIRERFNTRTDKEPPRVLPDEDSVSQVIFIILVVVGTVNNYLRLSAICSH